MIWMCPPHAHCVEVFWMPVGLSWEALANFFQWGPFLGNRSSWKIFNGFPEKSIFHIKIWSPTSVLVQYEQDLGGCFSGICTFLHTLFRAKTAFFGPWGPKFGQKYQKHSVTSCSDPKHDISEPKSVPCGNGQFWVLQTPQNPPRAPLGTPGTPGV